MANALKTQLKDLINWAAGRILIGVGAGHFRDEVNGVIQTILQLGGARARLREFDEIEKLINSPAPRSEVRRYIEKQRVAIENEWKDNDFNG